MLIKFKCPKIKSIVMQNIEVSIKDINYKIKIGAGILKGFRPTFDASKYAIITDTNVNKLYGKRLFDLLQKKGKVVTLVFKAGENSKNLETVGKILTELAKNNFDRDTLIIALGGGVVGDLGGFVASMYLRGIRYAHIPTTLLAQVDSSVGGKTGVNLMEGKNLAGSFYHPLEVLIDVDTLKTLPEREIKNGLAEVIKYAVTLDEELFDYLERNYSKRNKDFYLKIISESCRIKARIVKKDEKEKELRKVLNYGHTIGHAIEKESNYKISHGEAVGIGMAYEGKISAELGIMDLDDLKRQNKIIGSMGLPLVYKGNVDALIKIMGYDKKTKDGKLYFILPENIGKVKTEKGKVAFPVKESIVRKILARI